VDSLSGESKLSEREVEKIKKCVVDRGREDRTNNKSNRIRENVRFGGSEFD